MITNTLLTNLQAYYSFSEGSGTTTADRSGNGNTGTLTSGPTWVSGKIGSALNFATASNQYVNVPYSNSVNLNGSAGTLSAWVNFTTHVSQQFYILAKYSATTFRTQYYFYYDGANLIGGFNNVAGTYENIQYSSWNPTNGIFYHLVCVWDAINNGYIYINGVLVYTITTLSGVPWNASAGALTLGIYPNFTSGFNGIIDEIGIWSRALQYTEILQLYNNGNGIPYPFGSPPPIYAVGTSPQPQIGANILTN